jgi:hypothetical protein
LSTYRNPPSIFVAALLPLATILVPACSSSDTPQATAGSATVAFDPQARFDGEGAFFDFPYPSDLRVPADGAPDVAAFPDQGISILTTLKRGVAQRKGFPTVPVGYFRFTAKLAPRDAASVLGGGASEAVMLLDVDPASPERGKTFPVITSTPDADPYVPDGLLAVGARPGIVLAPKRTFAFVVKRTVGLEGGGEPTAPAALAMLARGETPAGDRGGDLARLYAPLWETLDKDGIPRADVVGATVFTTGDVVADGAALSDRALVGQTGTLAGFELEPDPTNLHPAFCHVLAKLTVPQFQKGSPPFKTEGLFELGPDGAPIKQRDETVNVSISVPKQPMPAGGYPLVLYLHGSGGVAREHVDGGDKGVPNEPGVRWPSEVLTPVGFAMAGADLPMSPGRVPGAQPFDYVNIDNVIMTRDLFRQGIVESRLFITALQAARIPASALSACTGVTLPAGETTVRFSTERFSIQGQSMGGMYTNLLGAIDPRIEAAVPTGAGGYLLYFLLQTPAVKNSAGLIAALLRAASPLTVLHPAIQIMETALEPIDPMVSAPRLAVNPLPGHPTRSIYEPVGIDDSYFPTPIYDAMALAYRHPRAGEEIWPTMHVAQELVGLDKVAQYPLRQNLVSQAGKPYTGIVAQYRIPGENGHGIYRRLEGVQHQFSCFHSSYRKTGVAVIPPPSALGTPCEMP